MSRLTIAAISDTHTHHRTVRVPDADVLVFSGDLMGSGYRHNEVKDFAEWFSDQPHKHKLMIAGNHDRMFESQLAYCLSKFSDNGFVYLENTGYDIDGFKFWGSPVQPWFYNWAFNVERGEAIKKYWDMIPNDTDVLITHGPPYGILDTVYDGQKNLGCEELWKTIHDRLSLKVHIFGHIHGGYGHESRPYSKMVDFYNASICDEDYRPVNEPWLISIENGRNNE